jgi:hypothetical protein
MQTVHRVRLVVAAIAVAALCGCGGCSLLGLRMPATGRAANESSSAPLAARTTGTGTARLSWDRPADGRRRHSRVAGYRIYVGPRPDALRLEAQIADPGATSYVIRQLPRGTSWFTVTSYNRRGVESIRPEPLSKTID